MESQISYTANKNLSLSFETFVADIFLEAARFPVDQFYPVLPLH
jgi:hypothetical protein